MREDGARRALQRELDARARPTLDGELPLLRTAPGSCACGAPGEPRRRRSMAGRDAATGEFPLVTVVDHKPFRLGMDADGGRHPRRPHRPRRRRARPRTTSAACAPRVYQPRSHRAAARHRRLLELPRSPVLRQPARHPRGARAPRRAARAPVGRARPGVPRAADGDGRARPAAASTTSALAHARYVVEQRPLPGLVRAARRPALPADLARHAAQAARPRRRPAGRACRDFERRWQRQQVRTGSTSSPPNRFSTPILRRAYAIDGEMLETGYPRNDVLARADRDELGASVRRRLGIPEGARRALRPDLPRPRARRRGRYRLDLQLDLERLRDALGDDTVVLFRKHHYIVDPVPGDRDGFVRDVSRYPDGDRAAARGRRAGHRLLVDDVRLRQHRPADALLHVRPRRVPRRDPRLLLRLRRQGARAAARRPPTSWSTRCATSTRSPPRTRTATRPSVDASASSTTAAPPERVVDMLFGAAGSPVAAGERAPADPA